VSRSTGIAEDVSIKFTDNISLRSITAYRDSQYHLSLDADASEFRAAEIYQAERAKQFSQEFNLVYNSKKFDGVVGLYYIREHNNTDNVSAVYTTKVYNAIAPILKADSKAVFAQGSYHFDNGVSVEFGGRATTDTKNFTQNYSSYSYTAPPALGPVLPGFPFLFTGERKWSAFTPRVGVNWKLTPDVMPYVSYTEGFKSGGYNYAAINAAGISFDPEKLKSLEAGIKTRWLDRRVLLNVTAFNYDYAGLQVQQALGPGIVQIANAATARVRGLELESQARVSPQLTLSANATFLDAKYRSFPAALVPNALAPFLVGDPRFTPGANKYNASGNMLNNAPKVSYTLSAQYKQPIGDAEAYLNVDYFHQSATNWDPSNAAILREPGYGLFNFALGYNTADRLWNTQLLVKNAFNKNYYVLRAANGLVPSAPSGAPRTIMLSVTRRFS
jgi:iron complex outermembrane recepter protein